MQTRENDDQLPLDWQDRQLGNYRLIRLVGRGGFASVYLGEHVHLQTQVAIKMLQVRLTRQDQESFLVEAQTIARLRHAHIVQVLEFGIEEGTPYLVMDYAPGGTLRQRYRPGTTLTPLRVLPYLRQVTDALEFAHEQRIVHRDVKPENMLLGPNNEVLLADFGIALGVQSSRSQSMEDIAGTVSYMAPELLQGRAMPASDQYSLAIVVYEWLSGAVPFRGTFAEVASQHLLTPPPPLRQPAVSPEVEQVVLKALHKDPQQRYASVQEFADAFERATLMGATEETLNIGPRQLALLRTMSQDAESKPVAEALLTTLPPLPISNCATGPLPTMPAAPSGAAAFFTPVTPATQVFAPESIVNAPASLPVQGIPASVALLSPPTVAKHPRRQRLMVISIIALILLLLGEFVGGGYFLLQASLKPSSSPPGTWNVTHVSDKQAQALYNQVTGKTPTYTAAMAANDSYNWAVESNGGGSCSFGGGAYHGVALGPPAPKECVALQPNFSDFAFQAQITITKGDSGGLFFRAVPYSGNDNRYFFGFDKEGVYSLLVSPNPEHLLLLHSSTAIVTGLNHPNLLTVIAQGSSIYLYINRHYVGSVTDASSNRGYLGIFAMNLSSLTNSTEVVCRAVQIWKLTTKLAM